ncbi:MAG: hypothetical protein ACRC2U_06645 [Aeromonas sp.]
MSKTIHYPAIEVQGGKRATVGFICGSYWRLFYRSDGKIDDKMLTNKVMAGK